MILHFNDMKMLPNEGSASHARNIQLNDVSKVLGRPRKKLSTNFN